MKDQAAPHSSVNVSDGSVYLNGSSVTGVVGAGLTMKSVRITQNDDHSEFFQELRGLVAKCQTAIVEFPSKGLEEEIQGEVATVLRALEKELDRKPVGYQTVRQTLTTLRALLEGAAGNALYAAMLYWLLNTQPS